MSDQHVIVNDLVHAADNGESALLVSVVRTAGSTYRGVGARMIVRADDTTAGLLSGGCLEADLVEHARRIRAIGEPDLVTYDTNSGDDFVWGLGLGCNGLVEVLLEPLTADRARTVAQLLGRALDGIAPAVVATVIRAQGEGAPRVGARMLIDSSTSEVVCDGDWGDQRLLAPVAVDAVRGTVSARRGMARDYTFGDGDSDSDASEMPNSISAQVAFELVTPRVDLVLCGSGPDAVPVARLATGLGWSVTVVDHRSADLMPRERFAGARIVGCPDATCLAEVVELAPRTAVVVMSHSYERDLDYLDALASTDVGYLGMLGPRTRTERMLGDLTAQGHVSANDLRHRIYGPIGLDIGGDGPEAIALSIIAEISAVVSSRSASHLRDRRAPIHGGVLGRV